MKSSSLNFLKKMIDTPSPSGYEQEIQKLWRSEASRYADEVHSDVHGNSVAVINPEGNPRIMLAGHCDEIGFLIRYIDDEGLIYFGPIGGHDINLVPGRRVRIYNSRGTVNGVTGKKAIHLLKEDEKKKIPEFEDLWIDIGVKNKKEAEKLIDIGDSITYAHGMEILNGDIVIGRAFDNRIGSFVCCEIIRLLKEKSRFSRLKAAVYAVSTVQEEIGLRGARTSAFEIDPQVGLAVDVTHATDNPAANKKMLGEIKIGGGSVILRGPNANPEVFRLLIETAKKSNLKYQFEGHGRGTGTDANIMQVTRSGVATGLVSIPTRYIHTPVELINLKDVENTIKLMADFCVRVDENTNFKP